MTAPNKSLFKNTDSHKKSVLNVLLIFTAFGGIMFSAINYQQGLLALANIELSAALISMALMIYLRKSVDDKSLKLIALAYVFMFCCIMMYAFLQVNISITAYSFALIIPLITHLLLGTRIGSLVTAVFFVSSYAIFMYRYGNHEIFNAPASIANIVTVGLLLWGLSYSYEHANKKAQKKLVSLASRDFLTGLFNRSMLKPLFQDKLEQAQLSKKPIMMLVADLDGFKRINDNHGHDTGDQVIKQFAQILQTNSGENGSCFRLGGEEFCIIFTQISHQQCLKIAEEIRKATENIDIISDTGKVAVTVSIGITTCANQSCSMTNLLKETDEKMYQAKKAGKNQVAV